VVGQEWVTMGHGSP